MLEQVEPSFWVVSGVAKIQAPSARVWEAIASPVSLESCHPFVEQNPVDVWPGVGAKDTIYYYSWLTFYREFYAWEEGVGYDLSIGSEGNLNNKVYWRIRPGGKNESTLTITVRALDTSGWKKLLYWAPLLVFYRPLLAKYLYSVVSGYEYFIRIGRPVARNQFGALKPFSPPV